MYYNVKEWKLSFYYTSENMSNKFRNPSRETLFKFLSRCYAHTNFIYTKLSEYYVSFYYHPISILIFSDAR